MSSVPPNTGPIIFKPIVKPIEVPKENQVVFSRKYGPPERDIRERIGTCIKKIVSSGYCKVSKDGTVKEDQQGSFIRNLKRIEKYTPAFINKLLQISACALEQISGNFLEKSQTFHTRYEDFLKKNTVNLDVVGENEDKTATIQGKIRSGAVMREGIRSQDVEIEISQSSTVGDIIMKMEQKSSGEVNAIEITYMENGSNYSYRFDQTQKASAIIEKMDELKEKGLTPSVCLFRGF